MQRDSHCQGAPDKRLLPISAPGWPEEARRKRVLNWVLSQREKKVFKFFLPSDKALAEEPERGFDQWTKIKRPLDGGS